MAQRRQQPSVFAMPCVRRGAARVVCNSTMGMNDSCHEEWLIHNFIHIHNRHVVASARRGPTATYALHNKMWPASVCACVSAHTRAEDSLGNFDVFQYLVIRGNPCLRLLHIAAVDQCACTMDRSKRTYAECFMHLATIPWMAVR